MLVGCCSLPSMCEQWTLEMPSEVHAGAANKRMMLICRVLLLLWWLPGHVANLPASQVLNKGYQNVGRPFPSLAEQRREDTRTSSSSSRSVASGLSPPM